jgi:hypothetical protein
MEEQYCARANNQPDNECNYQHLFYGEHASYASHANAVLGAFEHLPNVDPQLLSPVSVRSLIQQLP